MVPVLAAAVQRSVALDTPSTDRSIDTGRIHRVLAGLCLLSRNARNGCLSDSLGRAMNPELTEKDRNMVGQIRKLVQFLSGDYEEAASSARLRKLLPVAREYAPQLRDYGLLLAARLTEKNLSRGMNWATERLAKTGTSRSFART